jgi:hypothetical protein
MLRSGVTKAAKLRNPIAPSVTFVASARTTQQHPIASATLPLGSGLNWILILIEPLISIERLGNSSGHDPGMVPGFFQLCGVADGYCQLAANHRLPFANFQ